MHVLRVSSLYVYVYVLNVSFYYVSHAYPCAFVCTSLMYVSFSCMCACCISCISLYMCALFLHMCVCVCVLFVRTFACKYVSCVCYCNVFLCGVHDYCVLYVYCVCITVCVFLVQTRACLSRGFGSMYEGEIGSVSRLRESRFNITAVLAKCRIICSLFQLIIQPDRLK